LAQNYSWSELSALPSAGNGARAERPDDTPVLLAACFILPRHHSAKNKRTLLRESEAALHIERDPNKVVDMLYIMERSATHFFLRAQLGAGRKQEQIDEDFRQAAQIAAMAAPFRHARLSATKMLGDPNNPARFKDDATADELRAEIMKRLAVLTSAGLIDLEALPAPKGGIANQPVPGSD
jgi:hypothetical protein